MSLGVVFLACILSLPAIIDCCSCPVGVPTTRSYSLRSGVCSGDVFVATVTGATCNCLPSEGEESVFYCYDYQLESGEINVELVDRGQCYGQTQPYAVTVDAIHTCSSLTETREAGLVNGYTVEIPSNATLLPLRNLTDSSGRCDFPCLLSDRQYPNYYPGQACFYEVTITEVIKGNYTAGQRVMVLGPDTTTTCGNPTALLTINEQYVVGVGSICGAISPWSTLQSYSPNELETLRAFGQDFQDDSLTCESGAVTFVPSALSLVLSSMALVVMVTLFH